MTMDAYPLSSWAQQIQPSVTLAITAKAKALKAAGEDVCGFGAGEPDFDTPDFIKEACVEALSRGETKYAPAAGLPALREALAQKYRQRYDLKDTQSSQVIVSPGGKYSIYLALLATCSPGDEVLIPAPYWVSYPEMARLTGAEPVIVAATDETGFKLTASQVEAAITDKTRVLILNSPSNPTGVVYTRDELRAIASVAARRGVYVLSDEIYEDLLYDGMEPTCVASLGDEIRHWTITASGFSKSFSMTGWRLGTLVAPPPVAKAIADLQSQTTSNATTFAQYGALAALQQPDKAQAALDEMLRAFDRRRKTMIEALRGMEGVRCSDAQGAFYVFPNVAACGLDSTAFTTQLLEEEKVAVVPGSGFGDDACVRLSYAIDDESIAKGLERMARFCAKRVSGGA